MNVLIVYHTHVLTAPRQLLQLIYRIRQEMNRKVNLGDQFLIIDSFPVPVYQPYAITAL